MSDDMRQMLLDTLLPVLADHCTAERVQAAEAGGFDAGLWQVLDELGYPLAAVPEDAGGIGLGLADLCALLRLCGQHCAPVPLAESQLAAWLLARAGLDLPGGVLTLAVTTALQTLQPGATGLRLTTNLSRVASARHADGLVLLAEHAGARYVVRLTTDELGIEPGNNLAGEARDDVRIDTTVPPARYRRLTQGPDAAALEARAALLRAALMSGALQRVLQQSLDYARERRQFGRPLAAFQAIQQQLAILAAEVVAAAAAVDHAAVLAGHGPAPDAIAVAKVRSGKAAGIACRIAHQVHGAMGFTYEHRLHHLTRRLWAWRDEYGSDVYWSRILGQEVLNWGADQLWPRITAVSDPR
ncbi:MAG TPA: acyl-CoA dehydrogenase [Gammaproteobacteria bacterium]|nr:acyl-CoA dehydrogenase [Gammaproteobacteria bacterium]MCH78753.1 acyl-CoA dehydrogenase [Gammaproteobacteria bacterium]